MKLIDADSLMARANEEMGFVSCADVWLIQDLIDEQPSAEPQIIHCKDCKHHQFADNRAFGMPVKMCKWFDFEDVDDDDFCSFGERRIDGCNCS